MRGAEGSPRAEVMQAVVKGEALMNAGNWGAMARHLQVGFDRYAPLGDLEKWEKYHLGFRYYLNYQYDSVRAVAYGDSLKLLSAGVELPALNTAKMMFNEGDFLFNRKKYAAAFRAYHKGHNYVLAKLSPCQQSYFVHHLSLIRYRQRDYQGAAVLIRQALDYNNRCAPGKDGLEKFSVEQGALNSLMLTYHKLGKLDSASSYGFRALEYIKDAQLAPGDSVYRTTAMGVVLGNLGGVKLSQGELQKAEVFLKRSIALNDRAGYAVEDAQSAKFKMADLYLKRGEAEKAALVLRGALAKIDSLSLSPDRDARIAMLSLGLWSRIFSMQNNMAAAYRASEKYHRAKDSLERTDVQLLGTDLSAEFDSIDRENQIRVLNEDSRMKTFYLVCSGIIVLMGAFVWIYTVGVLRRSRSKGLKLIMLNQQLSSTVGQLEEAQHANQLLLKVVSHDLRNPIGGIRTITGMMLEEEGDLKEHRDTIRVINSSSEAAFSLIERLLEANPEVVLNREQIRLDAFILEVLALFEFSAKQKGQVLVARLLDVSLAVNRNEIHRVLSNLFSNAVKFGPLGSTITVRMVILAGKLEVSVADQGAGIPKDKHASVFDMYSGPGEPGTGGEKSFGMGLAISRRIIRGHDGMIGFRDADGGGTEFYFTLPLGQQY